MHEAVLPRLLAFLDEIGLPYRRQPIEGKTFLPGLDIERGTLLIDETKLRYPGDILHEAGHIAVMTSEKRNATQGNAGVTDGSTDGEEIAAILWSYAALTHIGLAPEIVFHEHGYRGQSDWFIQNFTSGTYMGLPLLEWMGLTLSPKKAAEQNARPFPVMQQWLRN